MAIRTLFTRGINNVILGPHFGKCGQLFDSIMALSAAVSWTKCLPRPLYFYLLAEVKPEATADQYKMTQRLRMGPFLTAWKTYKSKI